MYINWDSALRFDPNSLEPSDHGLPTPFYGNYGGFNYSAGTVGGMTPDPINLSDPSQVPKDALDTAFYFHDLDYQNNPGATVLPDSDFTLIGAIASLEFTDPEASLYAGFASLAIAGRLILSNAVDTPQELGLMAVAIQDALQNFEAGLAGTPGESRSLHGVLHVFEAKYSDFFV